MELSKSTGWSAPFYLMVAYITFAFLRPHEYELSPIIDMPVLPVLMALGLITWLGYGEKQFDVPQFYLAPILLALMCISMIAGGWPGAAPGVLRKFLPVLVMFILIASTVDTLPRQRLILKLMVLFVTIMAWHGITQMETGVGWSGAELLGGRITYVGIFNDPNDLGLLFISAIPMIVYLLYSSESFMGKLMLLASLGSVLYGVYLTNSRGTILGLLGTIGLYIWSRYGLSRAIILGMIGLPVLLAVGPSRLQESGDGMDESAFNRIEAWYQGLQLWMSHPMFGVGPERFSDFHSMNAHNSFIIVLAELGLVGAFVWVSFVGLSVYMMFLLQRVELASSINVPESEMAEFFKSQALAKTLMFSLLAFLGAAFFLNRTFDITLFLICGLSVAHFQAFRNRWPATPGVYLAPNFVRISAALIGMIAVLYVAMKVGLALGG